MSTQAPLELPAIYVADPFAAGDVRCPWCAGVVVIEDITAFGRGARRIARCVPCGLSLAQETRPIPGRVA
jgi:hypothetical protein